MEEKDLEDRRIDDAIKFIKETEQEHRGIISALFKQSGLAGLKGSKRFDALLKKTKGKRVHRGHVQTSSGVSPHLSEMFIFFTFSNLDELPILAS
uniref:Ferritin n=1 Tax=Globodera rostochiensis TaxID=31243 RepID=A0A914I882_GLORO